MWAFVDLIVTGVFESDGEHVHRYKYNWCSHTYDGLDPHVHVRDGSAHDYSCGRMHIYGELAHD
jgi:hypothetical protein